MDYYTRKHCGLCEEGLLQINMALQELRHLNLSLSHYDIDEDDALQEEYMMRVPVLKHGDVVVQEGNIDFVHVYDYIKSELGNI